MAIGLAVVATCTWAAGEIYESVVATTGLAAIDQPVLDAMVDERTPWLNTVATAFTDLGGPVLSPIWVSVVMGTLAWRWRSVMPVVLMVIATAGSLVITVVGKDLVGRARPPQALAVPPYEVSASFPSGHSLNAVVIAGIIAYVVLTRSRRPVSRRLVAGLAITYALVMGLSRVYLGHHWLTDVLTGWLLGLAWLAVVIAAHQLVVTTVRYRRAAAQARGGSSAAENAAVEKPD
nr:phosphatase PAP2 family protein [Kineosphaera limosa]